MDYGKIRLRLDEIIQERKISKNKICKDLDIKRSILNKYCSGKFTLIDANFICKLLTYFEITPDELIEHIKE